MGNKVADAVAFMRRTENSSVSVASGFKHGTEYQCVCVVFDFMYKTANDIVLSFGASHAGRNRIQVFGRAGLHAQDCPARCCGGIHQSNSRQACLLALGMNTHPEANTV